MAAYAKPGTLLYRDLSLAEHPYSLHSLGPWSPSVLAAPRRGPAAWPLRVTGDPKVDAHTRTRDVLQRSAAGGALLGQTLDLLLDGGCAQRCHIINSRYAHTGELEYLLQPLGDEATVVDVFGTGRHLRAHNDAPPRTSLDARVWARLSYTDSSPPTATTVVVADRPPPLPQQQQRSAAAPASYAHLTLQPAPARNNHSMLRLISEQSSLRYFGDNDCLFRDKRR